MEFPIDSLAIEPQPLVKIFALQRVLLPRCLVLLLPLVGAALQVTTRLLRLPSHFLFHFYKTTAFTRPLAGDGLLACGASPPTDRNAIPVVGAAVTTVRARWCRLRRRSAAAEVERIVVVITLPNVAGCGRQDGPRPLVRSRTRSGRRNRLRREVACAA